MKGKDKKIKRYAAQGSLCPSSVAWFNLRSQYALLHTQQAKINMSQFALPTFVPPVKITYLPLLISFSLPGDTVAFPGNPVMVVIYLFLLYFVVAALWFAVIAQRWARLAPVPGGLFSCPLACVRACCWLASALLPELFLTWGLSLASSPWILGLRLQASVLTLRLQAPALCPWAWSLPPQCPHPSLPNLLYLNRESTVL